MLFMSATLKTSIGLRLYVRSWHSSQLKTIMSKQFNRHVLEQIWQVPKRNKQVELHIESHAGRRSINELEKYFYQSTVQISCSKFSSLLSSSESLSVSWFAIIVKYAPRGLQRGRSRFGFYIRLLFRCLRGSMLCIGVSLLQSLITEIYGSRAKSKQ